jgi:hypothetical protein
LAITAFFGSTNLYKFGDEAQQIFVEDLVLYIYKGYMPLSTCENVWFCKLVLCECPMHYVSFSILFCKLGHSYNGHKSHGIACVTIFGIYYYYVF